MAERRCEFTGEGEPVIIEYEFDESKLTDKSLKIKIFDGVSEEWAKFILENRRSSKKYAHDYDIVIGPVADDGVVLQINRYLRQLIDLQSLVKSLEFRKLNDQYFFGTQEAIGLLKQI